MGSGPKSIALALTLLLVASCDRHEHGSGGHQHGKPKSTASAPPPLPTPVRPALPKVACRAIEVRGKARDASGRPLAKNAAITGKTWVVLPEGSRLTVKDTSSGREWTLVGPARALPCSRGAELVLLASGTLQTAPGVGTRPGAEAVVATPHGSFRYAEARADVIVEEAELRVEVLTGQVHISAAPGVELPDSVQGPKGKAKAKVKKPDAAARVDECRVAAQAAAEGAKRVVEASSDGGSLGDRAAKHVELRKSARAACSTAAAAAGTVEDAVERNRLTQRVDRAHAVWTAVPKGQK